MPTQRSLSSQIGFYLIFAVILALTFWLVRSYLDIIIFSLMMVVVLKPLYDRVLGWTRGRPALAAGLTLLLFFAAIVAPLALALSVVVTQATAIIVNVDPETLSQQVSGWVTRLQDLLGQQNLPILSQIQSWLVTGATTATTWLAQFVLGLGVSLPDLISRLFIFLGLVGALLPAYHPFVARLKRLSPLPDDIDGIFLHKIKVTIHSMFMGIFVIAVAQGLVTGLLFWAVGVPYTPLLTLVAVVASMFPLGASLVALPVGLFELLTGRYLAGVVVLAGYFLIVSNVDTFLRPRLVSKEAYLSFALVLISALGGYQLFGFFGVVYGPVLMILFLTALDVYERYYAPSDAEVPLVPAVVQSPASAAVIEPTTLPSPADAEPPVAQSGAG
jgi:predicted PurR-regulated permease PerM